MNLKLLILCCPLLLLGGCGALSSEHVETISAVLANLVAEGSMTQEQFDMVMGALQGIASGDWVSIFKEIASGAMTLVAGYFGIRFWRGSPTARKGAAPRM